MKAKIVTPKCRGFQCYRANTKLGICLVKKASDGLPLMCVGKWAKDKHYYLKRYLNLFITAMKEKWGGNLNYIDLFSGPGKCMVRDTEEEIDGSPLIALNSSYPFAKYIFVDIMKDNINALKTRCKKHPNFGRAEFKKGDCNKIMGEVVGLITRGSLSVAFIDPSGLDFSFSSLEELTRDHKVDLIINFPMGTAIKRNIDKFLTEKLSPLDEFLGDKDWREICIKLKGTSDRFLFILEYYKAKLRDLGYVIKQESVIFPDEITIKTKIKRIPLYYLLFASKHPLGSTFWRKIAEYGPSGQKRLKL